MRIRTDTFLCPEKCLGCRVRWGWAGAEHFSQSRHSLYPGGAVRARSFARGGRVSAHRSTRRFGHAALPPCSVFAPRRTTRRQCRVWLGRHRAASRAKRARAPPRLTGLLIQTRERHPAEAEPGPLHAVHIGTDTFLCPEKCPGCRVRWGEIGRSILLKAALPFLRAVRGCDVLRGVAASPSAAARGVSNTLHSHRAACSLRGALHGGRAASGSAGTGRQAGRNRPERRPALPHCFSLSLSFSSSRCYTGIKFTAKGGLLKYVSVPCGVFPCSAFSQTCSPIG